MEGACRIPVACCRPRILVLHALFWGLVSLRVFGSALLGEEKSTVKPVAAPCWQLEEFTVTTACVQCNAFETRSWPVCAQTGFYERVNCTKSNKDELKSCRSSQLEEQSFWHFEAAMLSLTALFGVVVVTRQRALDRLASEKVRRQIESI
ncbi:protein JTB isoform X2 [Boleophthalmus pectinirostris]|uniref:protein JTB isoform X2 n=1 Tax=Boleophthalmus pectinirostris TaxID=150288 RepID=UPI000A1C52E2|nr:protein JTB isoform X2 [Boleophthalmus pectinirostris]